MLKTLTLTTVGAAVIALGVVTQSEAAQVVAPVSASTDMGEAFGFPLIHTINQAGLLTNYTSGVTDFDSYLSENPQHHYHPGFGWRTDDDDQITSGSITFDLGGIFNLDGMAFWNRVDPFNNKGVHEFELFASLTGNPGSYTSVGSFAADQPPYVSYAVSGRPTPVQVFDFNTTAQFIQMDIQSNHGSPWEIGMAEVAFNAAPAQDPVDNVPEPLSILGSATALGVGILFKQKTSRRQKNQH